MDRSLKRMDISFLPVFVVWTADVMAGVEAAILDSDVNLRVEAIQGVATTP